MLPAAPLSAIHSQQQHPYIHTLNCNPYLAGCRHADVLDEASEALVLQTGNKGSNGLKGHVRQRGSMPRADPSGRGGLTTTRLCHVSCEMAWWGIVT